MLDTTMTRQPQPPMGRYVGQTDPAGKFQEAITAAGLTPPTEVRADGKLHRFPSNGRRGDDSGWYVLHTDGMAAGAFGCWKTGLTQQWCSQSTSKMTQAERDAYHRKVESMRQQREVDTAQRQQEAAATAIQRWQAATTVDSHPYLAKKGVKGYGVRMEGDALLIPMRDAVGTLHSLQTIQPDGDKRFQSGGRVKGCYHGIGKPDGELIICEGYATGASLHEATGKAVAVAFNAGNLLEVAQALHSKYPSLQLILAADDDWKSEGNPGLTKATEAAKAVGGRLVLPVFPESRQEKHTDFNDLHAIAGAEAVRQLFEAKNAPPADGVILANGADLTPEPVRWLWHGWLALGKLHILAGAPGQGKTTIALAIAATITQGGRLPDGSRTDAGNVLIWSGEDDPADTLLPRLLAAGAKRERCYFVQGSRIAGEVQPFDPSRDMAALERQALAIGGVKLLIVDPVVSAVTGDSHKNTEVRRALQPIVDLAQRLGAAVIGISHFSKGGAGGDPASRVVGSVAFTAVARVVLVAAKSKNKDGEETRILARAKSNIGNDEGGFEYSIEQSEPLPGIHASYVKWGPAVDGTAKELLREPDEGGDDGKSALQEAEDFLRQILCDGSSPNAYVQSEAKAAGIAPRTVRRASESLGVKKRKTQAGWYWSLPNCTFEDDQGGQDDQGDHVGLVGQVGHLGHVGSAETPGETTAPAIGFEANDVEVF